MWNSSSNFDFIKKGVLEKCDLHKNFVGKLRKNPLDSGDETGALQDSDELMKFYLTH